jgi:prophage tail gpP-like protein
VDAQTEYPGANPDEIATLYVGGMYFSDWETVWCQHRWHDPYNYFRFTCAERDPIEGEGLWSKVQWKPGDPCAIYLARRLALTGIILVRQIAAEANSHGVSLQGKGKAWELTSSILPEEGDGGGNFHGDLISIAVQVLQPTSVRLAEVIGTIPGIPFNEPDGAHFQQGETRWSFLERLARDRNVDLSNNKNGDLVLVGPHGPRISAVLKEPWRNNTSGGAVTDAPTVKADTGPTQRTPDGTPGDAPPAYLPGFVPTF